MNDDNSAIVRMRACHVINIFYSQLIASAGYVLPQFSRLGDYLRYSTISVTVYQALHYCGRVILSGLVSDN